MTDKIMLSPEEVKRINQQWLETQDKNVENMAAMSVMGATIEELKRENAELRAELAAIKPDWTTAPKAIYRALDSFGAWHLYQEEPYINNDVEYKGKYFDDAYWNGARDNMIPKWRGTLERRPEET